MTITVWQSIPRIVTVAGTKFRVTCEDWRTVPECERAMESVIEFARSTTNSAPNWDSLADTIMLEIGVPADAPYGCSIVAERLGDAGVICRDGLPQNAGEGEV